MPSAVPSPTIRGHRSKISTFQPIARNAMAVASPPTPAPTTTARFISTTTSVVPQLWWLGKVSEEGSHGGEQGASRPVERRRYRSAGEPGRQGPDPPDGGPDRRTAGRHGQELLPDPGQPPPSRRRTVRRALLERTTAGRTPHRRPAARAAAPTDGPGADGQPVTGPRLHRAARGGVEEPADPADPGPAHPRRPRPAPGGPPGRGPPRHPRERRRSDLGHQQRTDLPAHPAARRAGLLWAGRPRPLPEPPDQHGLSSPPTLTGDLDVSSSLEPAERLRRGVPRPRPGTGGAVSRAAGCASSSRAHRCAARR